MGSKNPHLNKWYCGITNIEKRRKAEHLSKRGEVSFWKCIDAGSTKKANEVEKYFSEKGTLNAPHRNGAISTSRYVCIFKTPKQSSGLNGMGAPKIEEIFKVLFED